MGWVGFLRGLGCLFRSFLYLCAFSSSRRLRRASSVSYVTGEEIDCFSALRVPFIWQANCCYWCVYGGWRPCNVGGWARLRLWEVAFVCDFAGLRFPSFLSLIPMGRAFSCDHRTIRTNGDVSNIMRATLSKRYEFQMCFPFCFPPGLSSSHTLKSTSD